MVNTQHTHIAVAADSNKGITHTQHKQHTHDTQQQDTEDKHTSPSSRAAS